MKRRQAEITECDTCAGNRQLLDALRQDVANLAEAANLSRVHAFESLRIAVANLEPGDIVVISSPIRLPDQEWDDIRAQFAQNFPGIKGMCVEAGLTVGVIHPVEGT